MTAFAGKPYTFMDTVLESPVCPTFNATLIFLDDITFLIPKATRTLVNEANIITTTSINDKILRIILLFLMFIPPIIFSSD